MHVLARGVPPALLHCLQDCSPCWQGWQRASCFCRVCSKPCGLFMSMPCGLFMSMPCGGFALHVGGVGASVVCERGPTAAALHACVEVCCVLMLGVTVGWWFCMCVCWVFRHVVCNLCTTPQQQPHT